MPKVRSWEAGSKSAIPPVRDVENEPSIHDDRESPKEWPGFSASIPNGRSSSGPGSIGRQPIGGALKAILGITAVVLVGAFFVHLNPTDTGSSAPPPAAAVAAAANNEDPSPWPPMVGQKYVIGEGLAEFNCYPSNDVLDKLDDARSKNDEEGFKQVAEAAHWLNLMPGDHVLVLGYNLLNGHLDVRVRTGYDADKECWYMVGNDNVLDGKPVFTKQL